MARGTWAEVVEAMNRVHSEMLWKWHEAGDDPLALDAVDAEYIRRRTEAVEALGWTQAEVHETERACWDVYVKEAVADGSWPLDDDD